MRVLTSVLAVGLLTFTITGCGPSIRPELKKEVDDLVAKYGSGSRGAVYPNTGAMKVKPWKVGQWVLVKDTDKEGKVSIRKMGITRQEGTAFWIESSSTSYFSRSDSAVLIDGFDMKDFSKIRILKAKMRDEQGRITDLNEDQLNLTGLANTFIQMLKQSTTVGQKEDVKINNLVFKDSVKANVKFEAQAVFPITGDGDVWYHSEVPIYGYAKSVMNAKSFMVNTTNTEEILDFGDTGAKSVFF